ncbi:MAG: DUF6125 family protein [Thermodesulfobacteriota bacterium]
MNSSFIETLSKKDLVEILGKCWMTHDGMWFYNTLLENGLESANRINKAAIRSLAPIEIQRFRKRLGIESVESYEKLAGFFRAVSELLIPDFMNISFTFPGDNTASWEFNERKCFAYNGINLLGVIDAYECGPIYRIRCWLDALGIRYTMDPDIQTCIMPSKGRCSGRISFRF